MASALPVGLQALLPKVRQISSYRLNYRAVRPPSAFPRDCKLLSVASLSSMLRVKGWRTVFKYFRTVCQETANRHHRNVALKRRSNDRRDESVKFLPGKLRLCEFSLDT